MKFFAIYLITLCYCGLCIAQKTTDIKILEKSYDSTQIKNQHLLSACKSWTISSKDIYSLYIQDNIISSEECNQRYYSLPCNINGTLIKGDTLYKFSMNAGGYGYLNHDNIFIYYGCKDTFCHKIALIKPEVYTKE